MVIEIQIKTAICVKWLNWWHHQAHFNELVEKNELSCIWSMLSTIFRYSTAKTRKYVKQQNISRLPITEMSIEKLILVRFLLPFMFRQMVENYASFWVTLPIFQVTSWNSAYKLFSILWSQILDFQYDIVMMSSWHNI